MCYLGLGPIDIYDFFDQVADGEHKYEVKAVIGCSFRCHFGKKSNFLFFCFFLFWLLWAMQSQYLEL